MWAYTDDEQTWLDKNASKANPSPSPKGEDYMPDYYSPTVEHTIDFYRQRAHELRHEAIGAFFHNVAEGAAGVFQQLGALTSGNHGKVEAVINELRGPTPRNAVTAGR
ncbi:hypothetical protein [Dongia rigui]|uniref:Uncharacterized protein n=1 Tax=Dongia rigui TaxID=940149 RepID=A0ABU5E2Y9_9PROT|nr:hypothetical protein [Dongia rigui]MDY0873941.1 hypothetical protein [Dongia rigui]